MRIKIASWNIAGGHTIASRKHLDYNPEDIAYFVAQLRGIDADIVCLQESHTSADGARSNAEEIAAALGYPNVFNSVSSISHIEDGYMLSTAILSKLPFRSAQRTFFPEPSAPLYWPDGREAVTHEKNLQVVALEHFSVANNQMLPLRLFGHAYDDGAVGSELARGIDRVMAEQVFAPVLWCGDFNWPDPLAIYPHLKGLGLTEALPDKETRPSIEGAKKRPDHIYYSPEFSLIGSDVITVNADHYLCWAELELP